MVGWHWAKLGWDRGRNGGSGGNVVQWDGQEEWIWWWWCLLDSVSYFSCLFGPHHFFLLGLIPVTKLAQVQGEHLQSWRLEEGKRT